MLNRGFKWNSQKDEFETINSFDFVLEIEV